MKLLLPEKYCILEPNAQDRWMIILGGEWCKEQRGRVRGHSTSKYPKCDLSGDKPLCCLSVSVLLKPTNKLDIRQIWCHSLSHRYWRIYQIYTLDYFTLFILSVDYILGWSFHECLPVFSDLQMKEGAVGGKQNHTEPTRPFQSFCQSCR